MVRITRLGRNCRAGICIFGIVLLIVGILLTIIAYRNKDDLEDAEYYVDQSAQASSSFILGPVCIFLGLGLIIIGVAICLVRKRDELKQQRIGFHCPVHGDFFPLSPVLNTRKLSSIDDKSGAGWSSFLRPNVELEKFGGELPLCPHSLLSNERMPALSVAAPSSLSALKRHSDQSLSPCPTPLPFVVSSEAISDKGLTAASLSPTLPWGSIRSLSVPHDVACFPHSAHSERSSPNLMQSRISTGVSVPTLATMHRHSTSGDSKKWHLNVTLPTLHNMRPTNSNKVSPSASKDNLITAEETNVLTDVSGAQNQLQVNPVLPTVETPSYRA